MQFTKKKRIFKKNVAKNCIKNIKFVSVLVNLIKRSIMKQKCKLIAISTVAIMILIATSCSNVKTSSYKPHTLLWEVKKDNHTLYLLGSVHIGTKDMYPLDTVITSAFNKSDILGVEINPKNVNFLDILPVLFDMSGNSTTKIPDEVYEKLNQKLSLLSKLGLSSEMIKKMKPVGIAFMLELLKTSDLISELDNLSNKDIEEVSNSMTLGVDNYFLHLADSLGKEVYEMEAVRRQVKAFENLEDVIVEYISSSLDKKNQYSVKDFEKMILAWRQGNIEDIFEFMNMYSSDNKEIDRRIKDELIFKRNNEMTQKVEKLIMEDKQYFIVVGAGHLIGKDSIIDILDKTGKYKIKRY